MTKIFISYNRTSKDIVEQLVQDLTDDPQETWFDQHLTGGQKWWDNILSEIRKCEIFVAALTPDFLESLACRREAKYAKDLYRILLPVRLSDKLLLSSLPPDFSEIQWVDYSRPDKQAFKNLQRTLRQLPKAPPLPDPLPDPPAVPISYLNTLRMKIDTDSKLDFQDQIQLVFELRRQFRNGDPAKEIGDLLQRLKKRDDLFAIVLQDIDDLLREIDSGQRSAESVRPPTLSTEFVTLSESPIVDDPVAPSEPTSLDPSITPISPNVLPGTGIGGELEAKKSTLSLAATKALFVPAVFAIGVVILAVYFFFAPDTRRAGVQPGHFDQSVLVEPRGDSNSNTDRIPEAERKAAADAKAEADRVAA
jgi:hypothetical protein